MTTTYGAILAAGLGTRLRPLTNEVPKPSLPICGRPLLEYGIDLLERAGVAGVGVNTHYQASVFEGGFEPRNLPVRISHEEELLGTGGGLKRIASMFPRSRFISINGDALLECELDKVLERHVSRGALATMVLRRVPKDSPFARVGHDEHHRIYRISEVESPGVESRQLTYSAYTGVQIVEADLLDRVSAGPCDVIRTGYRSALSEGLPIYADFVEGLWLDVGTPERYYEANVSLASLSPAAKQKWRLPMSAVGTPHQGWIHPQTSIGDGVQLGSGVIINKPSIIRAGAELSRVVCSSAVDLNGSLANVVAYQERGVTRYIELK